MRSLFHPNVVRLHGVALDVPPLMLLVEIVKGNWRKRKS